MSIAAVPAYLGNDFRDASPGMRFGMYLKLWGINRRTHAVLWETHDIDYEVRGQNRQEREVKYENKVSALADAKRLATNDQKTMQGLLARQKQVFEAVATEPAAFRLDALAIAPFTTGLGNEHPLENGFAFLNPYGLPYLPGSGVKGVLRQAARELASGDWDEKHDWDATFPHPKSLSQGERDLNHPSPIGRGAGGEGRLSTLDALFGLESGDGDTVHLRGALTFWDVIPQIEGNSLMVEIMTPHQSHYYQNGATPHESGQPTPISFLTVPPGSRFVFHVQCDLAHLKRLAPELAELAPDSEKPRWQVIITHAFEHAFTWLGFGAKTAVGYGAMERDKAAETAAEKQRAERVRQAQEIAAKELEVRKKEEALNSLSPVERAIQEFLDNRTDKNQSEISAVIGAIKQGRWQGKEKLDVAQWLKNKMQATKGQWKEKSQAKIPVKDREHQNTLLVIQWLQGA